jgi:hypothetical protein
MLTYQSYLLSIFQWINTATQSATELIVKSMPDAVEAIELYKGSMYADINQYLRNATQGDELLDDLVSSLKKAIALKRWTQPPRGLKCIKKDFVAFRLLYGEIAERIIRGEVKKITNKSFSSFALDPTHSLGFASNEDVCVLLVCKIATGTNFCFIDAVVERSGRKACFQSELLFAPGLVIDIMNVSKTTLKLRRMSCYVGGRKLLIDVNVAFAKVYTARGH